LFIFFFFTKMFFFISSTFFWLTDYSCNCLSRLVTSRALIPYITCICFHKHSIVYVWPTVRESIKFLLWLTVWFTVDSIRYHRRVYGGGRVGTGLPSDVLGLLAYNSETMDIYIVSISVAEWKVILSKR
jgi:hypothetical protein